MKRTGSQNSHTFSLLFPLASMVRWHVSSSLTFPWDLPEEREIPLHPLQILRSWTGLVDRVAPSPRHLSFPFDLIHHLPRSLIPIIAATPQGWTVKSSQVTSPSDGRHECNVKPRIFIHKSWNEGRATPKIYFLKEGLLFSINIQLARDLSTYPRVQRASSSKVRLSTQNFLPLFRADLGWNSWQPKGLSTYFHCRCFTSFSN